MMARPAILSFPEFLRKYRDTLPVVEAGCHSVVKRDDIDSLQYSLRPSSLDRFNTDCDFQAIDWRYECGGKGWVGEVRQGRGWGGVRWEEGEGEVEQMGKGD